MKALNEINLSGAALALAVANTPPFLMRKLQSDPSVRLISETFSDEQILDGLRALAGIDPGEPLNAVRPYAYLTALWMKPRPDALRVAAGFSMARWRWYEVIASYLNATYSPISTQIFQASNTSEWGASPTSAVPATSIILLP